MGPFSHLTLAKLAHGIPVAVAYAGKDYVVSHQEIKSEGILLSPSLMTVSPCDENEYWIKQAFIQAQRKLT